MEKKFLIKNETDIPEIEDTKHNISSWFFARVENLFGDEVSTIVCYDFTKGKWISIKSGMKKLIEYYIES